MSFVNHGYMCNRTLHKDSFTTDIFQKNWSLLAHILTMRVCSLQRLKLQIVSCISLFAHLHITQLTKHEHVASIQDIACYTYMNAMDYLFNLGLCQR